jgi:RND family efflux transporter MFP subunit
MVSLHARVAGYVEKVLVDRGSVVKQGQLLVELSAPEMTARVAEAASRVHAAESERLQAAAQLAGAQSTWDKLKKAAEQRGVIAGNELTLAEKQVDAARALVSSRQQTVSAAEAAVRAFQVMQTYLQITAPFAGVVTDRLIHPGALVGPGADAVLLVIQQVSHLRLIVAVPEQDIGGIVAGAKVEFKVPAFPERTYAGAVARVAHSLDPKTRTMPVELDVLNRDGSVSPGMYPSVKWPVRRTRPSLLFPKTSVVTNHRRTHVRWSATATGRRIGWM